MKKLLLGILAFSFSVNAVADCVNAYKLKAQRRAKTNKIIKQSSTIAIGGAATAATIAVTVSSGGTAMVFATPIALIVGTGLTGETFQSISENKNNNFYKALAVVEAAKINAIPEMLLEKLDKKMSYYSYSDYEQQEMNKAIVKIVNEANASKKLCTKKGKIKPMNFNKLVRYVRDELRETL